MDLLKPDSGPAPCVAPKVVKRCTGGWCELPPGCFTMGMRSGHACQGINEIPHKVALSHELEISVTEVTQAQFKAAMKYSPSSNSACGVNCPVENVTWQEAAAYCNALSSNAGLTQCYKCTGSGKTTACSLAQPYSGGEAVRMPGLPAPHRRGVGVCLPGRHGHRLP